MGVTTIDTPHYKLQESRRARAEAVGHTEQVVAATDVGDWGGGYMVPMPGNVVYANVFVQDGIVKKPPIFSLTPLVRDIDPWSMPTPSAPPSLDVPPDSHTARELRRNLSIKGGLGGSASP
jgi:hypothetical protein